MCGMELPIDASSDDGLALGYSLPNRTGIRMTLTMFLNCRNVAAQEGLRSIFFNARASDLFLPFDLLNRHGELLVNLPFHVGEFLRA
jgi:hypothetical protein